MSTKKSGLRFCIFARVSTSGQAERGFSLADQETRGREYVEKLGGSVVRVIKGVESGTKAAEDRVLLNRMLAEARQGRFDAVWVIDRSRLSRSPGTTERTLAMLAMLACGLHTASGEVDLESEETEFLATMEAGAFKLAARLSRKRSIQNRQTLLAEGVPSLGRAPWGRKWRKQDKRWEVDPVAQRQAREMYRAYVVQGKSLKELSAQLNVPRTTLHKRLQSAGMHTLHCELGGKSYDLEVPSLLDPAQAAAIARRLRANATTMPGGRHRALLQGVVRCTCGSSLSHTSTAQGTQPVYRHLIATRREGCVRAVPAPMLEKSVLAAVGDMLSSKAKLQAAVRAALQDTASGTTDRRAELRDAEEEIKRLDAEQNRTLDLLTQVEQTAPAKARLLERLKKSSTRLDTLRKRLDALKRELGESSEGEPARVAEQLQALFGRVGPIMRLKPAQQRELLTLVCGRSGRASPHGIFVRQDAYGSGRKDLSWSWELRGVIAPMTGEFTHYEMSFERSGKPSLRPVTDDSMTERLARIAGKARKLKKSNRTRSWKATA